MEYKIVLESDRRELEAVVNKSLEMGWKLQGGVSVALDDSGYSFAQAMTKEKPNKFPFKQP